MLKKDRTEANFLFCAVFRKITFPKIFLLPRRLYLYSTSESNTLLFIN